MDFFTLCLGLWALLFGISKFVSNETLSTVCAVAAIVVGVLALIRL